MAFNPDRSLLNPKFEGYKLDPISEEDVLAHHLLPSKPTQATISRKVPLSFQEVQSRIRHNHLSVFPNANQAVYIDDEMRVVSINMDEVGNVSTNPCQSIEPTHGWLCSSK